MRLLELDDSGRLSLMPPASRNVPKYAILSHTWGADGEEFTHEDMIKGTGQDKCGYRKLKFCAEQARRDGMQYSWVETCCSIQALHR